MTEPGGILDLFSPFGLTTHVDHFTASRFDSSCIAAVRAATRALGLPHREMVSGAGHDAIYIARVAPTSMIFVPCKDGISHNEIEDARPEHLEAGANVLLHAILARALGSRVTSDSSGTEGG